MKSKEDDVQDDLLRDMRQADLGRLRTACHGGACACACRGALHGVEHKGAHSVTSDYVSGANPWLAAHMG
eukprot:g81085.t1